MPSREQFARALGSIAAGFAIAWEHLREPVELAPEPVVGCCPICATRVGDAPHIHDQDVIWPTCEDGVLMLTDLGGGRVVVIPEPEIPEPGVGA